MSHVPSAYKGKLREKDSLSPKKNKRFRMRESDARPEGVYGGCVVLRPHRDEES